MASETHHEDPRTGCWQPAEGHTAESVFELYRGELPHGSELAQLCPTDGCANPDHLRPTFHVTAGVELSLRDVKTEEVDGVRVITSAVVDAVSVSAPEPAPVPQAPVKRGPGRPRKPR